jgi:hypothetical protein
MFGLAIVRAEHPPTNDHAPQPTKRFSKPVRASGVDFEVAAEPLWHRPGKIYGVGHAPIELRITNRSDQDLTFDLGDHLLVSLRGANDTELVLCAVPQKFLPQTLKVAAGKSETVALATELVHTRIGQVCLGLQSDSGWNWLTDDLLAGKYRLRLAYENKQQANAAWLGKMQTESLEIEIKDAP